MIEFLFFILMIFIVAKVAGSLTAQNEPRAKLRYRAEGDEHINCPPHRWQYERSVHQDGTSSDEFLICKYCRLRPGQIQTNYDKPY